MSLENISSNYLKKWWNITPEEFKKAKTEFYGQDMDLHFWEDFEKLDLWKKVDYIFERFWDTDYAADLIIKLLKTLAPKQWGTYYYVKNIRNELIDNYNDGNDYNYIYRWLSEKFWKGIVKARIYYYLVDQIIWEGNYSEWVKWLTDIVYEDYKNMTQNTLKKILLTENFKKFAVEYLPANTENHRVLEHLVRWCKDWEISDLWLIKVLKDNVRILRKIVVKLSPELQKYIIEYKMQKYKWDFWCHAYIMPKESLNFWKWVDVFDSFMDLMLKNLDDKDLDYFCEGGRDPKYWTVNNYFLKQIPEKHKKIADLFIKAWKKEIVEKYINHFTWLTDEEKTEIIWK